MSGPVHTPFCDLVGVEHPIVQTGMGWVSGAKLTAATAGAGALGILASATMTLDQLAEAIAEVQQRTDRPFGVNLRADQPDLDQRIDLLISEGVKVASFASPPGAAAVARLASSGVIVIPTIGAPRHAVKMAEIGVHAVIAQGMEGGGHTGEIPTSVLVPACVDAVEIPVVAAGGFRDGRGLVAALAWGSQGIAMGTRFLLTRESTVPGSVKQRYLDAGLRDTVRTEAIDGHPQRVIRTEVVDRLERASVLARLPRALANAMRFRNLTGARIVDLIREARAMRRSEDLTWAQLAMAANAPMLTRAALVEGHLEAGILPTGQVVGEIADLPTVAEVIEATVAEASLGLARSLSVISPCEHRPTLRRYSSGSFTRCTAFLRSGRWLGERIGGSMGGWSRRLLVLAAVMVAATGLPLVPAAAVTPGSPSFVTSFGSFGSGLGQFSQPNDVAVSPDGTVYVTDRFNARVQAFRRSGSSYSFLLSLGSYGTGPAGFHQPTGIALDANGWLYVADYDLDRVQVFDAGLAHRYTWGASGAWPGAFDGPDGIAVGPDGTVYVVDSGNHRVQRFTVTGTYLGGWGSFGSTAGKFDEPRGVAVDGDGYVYVTDQNNTRVQVFTSTGTFVRQFGTGGSGAGQFQFPVGVAVDRNRHVFVVDRFQKNLERWVSVPEFALASYVSSFGSGGSGGGQFNNPYGVEVSRDGYLFVADTLNNRVQVFDLCAARFWDVAAANPFFDAICWMTATGVGLGFADGSYRPLTAVSRQVMAAHLYRLSGSPAGPFPDPGLSDVPPSHPFYLVISWMVYAGVANGYADGTFRPTEAVSRQAMSAFLNRLVGAPGGYPDPGFSDVTASNPFFEAIAWMAFVGISTGFPDGSFRPLDAVSRQWMSAFLARFDAMYHSP